MSGKISALSRAASRLALVVLACALALATALSAFTVAELSDHDCQGDDCPICVVVDLAQALLSTFAATSATAVVSRVAFAAATAAVAVWVLDFAFQTPVTRGDQLLI